MAVGSGAVGSGAVGSEAVGSMAIGAPVVSLKVARVADSPQAASRLRFTPCSRKRRGRAEV